MCFCYHRDEVEFDAPGAEDEDGEVKVEWRMWRVKEFCEG